MIFLSASQKQGARHRDHSLAVASRMATFFAGLSRTAFFALAIFAMSSLMTETFAQSQAAAERLLQAPPKGFKVVSREVNKTSETTYMIPEDQAAAFWKERISTQIIYNPRSTSYFTFRSELQRQWQDLCDASSVDYAREGMQNGYATHLWLQACRFRDTKNKPIFGLTKMIDGATHAYVVQVVFRYAPDDAQLSQWSDYLNTVELCGTGTSQGRNCHSQ